MITFDDNCGNLAVCTLLLIIRLVQPRQEDQHPIKDRLWWTKSLETLIKTITLFSAIFFFQLCSIGLQYEINWNALFMGNITLSFSDGEYCFEILATDKSSRNVLIPAVRPSSGFSARELKKACGQGALYLRLIESSPSDHEVLVHIYI